MFLKKLYLSGFKSFCEPAEVNFGKGVSAIVGPNGCGKSNIVDAIKWVIGEQKTSMLRADSMTDVIFKGTESHKGLGRAEVRLTIANDEGILPEQYDEVEIDRIIYASGENEYYINKQKVRLKDIQALFFDTGVGKSAYSVMEQGKIDLILSNKPEDRRYLIEEAAGITKYRVQREESNRKLAETDDNLAKVKIQLNEVKNLYEKTVDKAEKAKKCEEYEDKAKELEIELNLNRIDRHKKNKSQYVEELDKAQKDLDDIKVQIDSLQSDVADRMIAVNSLETQRIDMDRDGFQIDSDIKIIESQSSGLKDRLISLGTDLKVETDRATNAQKRLKEIADELDSINQAKQDITDKIAQMMQEQSFYENDIKNTETQMADNEEEIENLKNRVTELNTSLEQLRVEHKDVTDKMIEQIDKMLASIDVDSTEITAIKDRLQSNIRKIYEALPERAAFIDDIIKSNYLANNSTELMRILGDLRQHIADLETTFAEVDNDINSYIKTTEVFMDNLFSPEGAIQTKKRVENEIQKASQAVRECTEKSDGLFEQNRQLSEKKDKSRDMLHNLVLNMTKMREQHNSFDKEVSRIFSQKSIIETSRDEATQKVRFIEEKIAELREQQLDYEDSLNQLRTKKTELTKRINEIVNAIQKENAKMGDEQRYMKEVNQRFENKNNQINNLKVKIAELDSTINSIYESFYENQSINLSEYESKGGYITGRPYEDVRKELSDIRQSIQALGSVDRTAITECKLYEDRYKLLKEQLEDVEKARKDILEMIADINRISEELFVKTFNQVKTNFRQMFRKLFDGGNADMTLTDPNNLLSTGIDIIARPPGQNAKSITLLSGGQRTMTAISLMFSTFLVKPSPFCILDEIDAALDEENVTRFVKLLNEFRDTSQFVIITHDKKTMTAADVMYGVTQEQKGISKVISAKLGDVTVR
ncbi:MAG: AAA family ATPase [Spirochaetales bacterium]|nr:AAA family ATPase [Spirochaetales bacterium]